MKYLRNFKSLEEARAEGEIALDSPHASIVSQKPARNFKFVEGADTFRAGFDDDGWLIDPRPLTDFIGRVAYYNGYSILTCKMDDWSSEMGVPLGVVVIPPSFLPDGKCRIIALTGVNKDSSAGDEYMKWGPNTATTLTYYGNVVTWNNDITNPSYNLQTSEGCLSSDSDDFTKNGARKMRNL